jgi:hypothetical protein
VLQDRPHFSALANQTCTTVGWWEQRLRDSNLAVRAAKVDPILAIR